jgi:hypothetical protein
LPPGAPIAIATPIVAEELTDCESETTEAKPDEEKAVQ